MRCQTEPLASLLSKMGRCCANHVSRSHLHVQWLVQLVTRLVLFPHHQSPCSQSHVLLKYGCGLSYSEFFWLDLHSGPMPKLQLQQTYFQKIGSKPQSQVYVLLDDPLYHLYESLLLPLYQAHRLS